MTTNATPHALQATADLQECTLQELCTDLIRRGKDKLARGHFGDAMVNAAYAAIKAEHDAIKAAGKGTRVDPTRDFWRPILQVGFDAMGAEYKRVTTPRDDQGDADGYTPAYVPPENPLGGPWPADLIGWAKGIKHPEGAQRKQSDGSYKDLSGAPKGTIGMRVGKHANRAINLSLRYDANQDSRKAK